MGPRRGVEETAYLLGVDCAPLDGLGEATCAGSTGRCCCCAGSTRRWTRWSPRPRTPAEERRLARELSELRLVKDDHEVRMLERAVAATIRGFEDVVRALPEAMEQGERVVEGVFDLRARVEGNDVGYETIAASGAHATILHWTRNDGAVRSGDLLLLDAGVEGDELYTADVTRTLPVSGRFTADQRRLYELVHRAQQAAIAEVRPGSGLPRSPPGRDAGAGRGPGGARPPPRSAPRRRSPRTGSSTAATPSTAPPTCSASTSTTAPTPARRSTAGARSAPATCSPSSPASTSSPTTSPSPRRCGASGSGSRTTSW